MVEVVGMLVVAQEHGIDFADGLGRERGGRRLYERRVRQLVLARRIEGWVGENAKSGRFQESRRPADERDPQRCHGAPPSLSSLNDEAHSRERSIAVTIA
jgi:hypothetical protein